MNLIHLHQQRFPPSLPKCTLALQCSGILTLVSKCDGHFLRERGTSDSGNTTHFSNLEVKYSSPLL